MTIAILIAYLAIQFFISLYISRGIKSESDYLLAGRQVGFWLASFSLFATWFGAETVMGSSGAVAAQGLSGGRADPFGYTICLILFGLLISYKMRAQAYMTLGDFFRDKYGRATEILSIIVMTPTSLFWAAAQILALGHILSSLLGVDLTHAILAGLGAVMVLTWLGGMMGDIVTDFIQGVVMAVGLGLILLFVFIQHGHTIDVSHALSSVRLSLIAPDESLMAQIDTWMIAIVGSLMAQEAISRILATKSPSVARQSCFGAAGLYITVGLMPVLVGLFAYNFIQAGDDSDGFLPKLAENILPYPAYVIFIGALVSAIMSTVNSTLLAVSALLGHNIIHPLLKTDEKKKVMVDRLIVILSAIAVFFIATSGENIFGLIELSSTFGAAGLVVTIIAGLWLKRTSPLAGLITIIAGTLITITATMLEWEATFTPALVICTFIYITSNIWLYKKVTE
ncbi:MAG: sodium:solute symporter [Alphaproteobacteria bacterium]|nr:sodium:solute symporter [Alphaproteobacteria bacterium]